MRTAKRAYSQTTALEVTSLYTAFCGWMVGYFVPALKRSAHKYEAKTEIYLRVTHLLARREGARISLFQLKVYSKCSRFFRHGGSRWTDWARVVVLKTAVYIGVYISIYICSRFGSAKTSRRTNILFNLRCIISAEEFSGDLNARSSFPRCAVSSPHKHTWFFFLANDHNLLLYQATAAEFRRLPPGIHPTQNARGSIDRLCSYMVRAAEILFFWPRLANSHHEHRRFALWICMHTYSRATPFVRLRITPTTRWDKGNRIKIKL